jgi:hypothetical protein
VWRDVDYVLLYGVVCVSSCAGVQWSVVAGGLLSRMVDVLLRCDLARLAPTLSGAGRAPTLPSAPGSIHPSTDDESYAPARADGKSAPCPLFPVITGYKKRVLFAF